MIMAKRGISHPPESPSLSSEPNPAAGKEVRVFPARGLEAADPVAAEHREQGEEDQQEKEIAPCRLVADHLEAGGHRDRFLGGDLRVDDEVVRAGRQVAEFQLFAAVALAPAFAAVGAVPVGDLGLRSK